MKIICWSCLKLVLLFVFIISLSLVIYIHYKGSAFDPIREIQKLSSDNRRDDALDLVRFFTENQIADQDKFTKIEKALEYTPTEKIKSFVWNGAIKGEVYDNYSGLGAITKVMLLSSYHLAARRGETFRAKKSDIDFENEKIRLWTRKRKGGDLEFDWMPMTQELKTALLSWLEVRMSQPTIDTEHIFVCLDKTPFCDQYYGKPFTNRQHFMRRIDQSLRFPCGIPTIAI